MNHAPHSQKYCCITGATGLLGQALQSIWSPASLQPLWLSKSASQNQSSWFSADLLRPATLEEAPWNQVTCLVNTAAVLPDIGTCFADNVKMTQNILAQLEGQSFFEHFIQISSTSVYQLSKTNDTLHLVEESPLRRPDDSYPGSKRRQEELTREVALRRGWKYTVLRIPAMYGKSQRQNTALAKFIGQAKRGDDLIVNAPKNYRQNYVAAVDVATIIARVISDKITGTFNVFSDDTVSILALANQVIRLSNSTSQLIDRTTDTPYPKVTFSRAALDNVIDHKFRTLEEELVGLL